jgi:acetyl-CoA carboxylase biotin carboxylase subunit
LDESTAQQMGEVSIRAAKAVGYYSAGTIEFLLDADGSFYFLEMNTRLQVEHPITELVTGTDLVREMIRVASGQPLGYGQADIVRRGSAIECRVYAEDPSRGFLPSPGTLSELATPAGPGVRDDSGVFAGYKVTPYYDPLISKLCTWGADRAQAIARMSRALREYRIGGIRTNLQFHQNLMRHPEFQAGNYDTGFIERHSAALTQTAPLEQTDAAALAQAIAAAHATDQLEAGKEAATRASAGGSAWAKGRGKNRGL